MRIVLDTNVLVYAFLTPEFVAKVRRDEWLELHGKARRLYEKVLAGRHILFIPSVVLVELGAVISGMTRDENKARMVVENVKNIAWIVYDDPYFTEKCIEYGIKLRLSGFDTKIAACAIENSANLITDDRKFYEKFSQRADEYKIRVYLLRQMSINQIEQL